MRFASSRVPWEVRTHGGPIYILPVADGSGRWLEPTVVEARGDMN